MKFLSALAALCITGVFVWSAIDGRTLSEVDAAVAAIGWAILTWQRLRGL